MSLRRILLLVLIFIIEQQIIQPNLCNTTGTFIPPNYCSCFSGYEGTYCQQKAPTDNTCFWNTNSQTTTNFYPTLNSLTYANDYLNFQIFSPLVIDRLNTTIFIQDLNNINCTFPGLFSTNSLTLTYPCGNLFTFSIPWVLAKKCNWDITTTHNKMTYSGNIFVNQIENTGVISKNFFFNILLGGVPVQRSVLRVIPININFQTSISLTR
jgi:hypothetical protein